MPSVRRFLDLDAREREQLFAFTAAHDPDRFPDGASMERGYMSSAFEGGETQFSCWEGGALRGAMGAVIRDAGVRGEVFITAVAVEPGDEAAFDALLERAMGCVPALAGLVVRMGVSPQHPHLEALVARHGFALEYDGLIMAGAPDAFALPADGAWRVETVDAGNREAYRQVLDDAFRSSPNGASVSEEQVTELMAEISHADLLGVAWWEGQPAAAFELCLQEETGWIEAIAVAPALQGRGHGRRMLASALERLRGHGVTTVKLLVMSSNETAVRLYRQCGFSVESVYSRWWRLDGA